MSSDSDPRPNVESQEPIAADASPSKGIDSKPAASLEAAIGSSSIETLQAAAADPALSEDLALALLQRMDLPSEVLERLGKSRAATGRKVKLALVGHPKTPRHVSLSLLRQLFTFDLMQVALTPVIAGDIKVAAEETLLKRLESIASGARLSLARRASGRVAAALLLDAEPRVVQVALENPRLTEAMVRQALLRPESGAGLVRAVCEHPKWSLRREIRLALLHNQQTPVDRAVEFARSFTPAQVQEVLRSSRLPAIIKSSILSEVRK
ncbi:MAG TPA: hypothetical protein VMH03_03940 [Terriglobales bacterium]|nr:hypothetical protein [Terriglobales bacterium]